MATQHINNNFPDTKILAGGGGDEGYSPIVDLSKAKKIIVRDFTKDDDDEKLEEGVYDIGRYNEMRPNMYTTEMYQKLQRQVDGYSGVRCIHMGLDIGGPVGTAVMSFHDGYVHKFGYNPEKGDYGHCIILSHEIQNTTIYSLYGHLSAKSVGFKYEGMPVKKGEIIGWFGSRTENGDWPPHVHFQLSWLKPQTHDLPGVVSLKDHPKAELQYPDPRLVLGSLYPGSGLIRPASGNAANDDRSESQSNNQKMLQSQSNKQKMLRSNQTMLRSMPQTNIDIEAKQTKKIAGGQQNNEAKQTKKIAGAAAGGDSSSSSSATCSIEEFLLSSEAGLVTTVLAMFSACKEIAEKIRTASCDKHDEKGAGSFNAFGDEQLAIDVLADNIIFDKLRACGSVGVASSEEEPTEVAMGGSGYSVAFDPLDGSSIIDTNFAVGTIFGVWPGSNLTGITGKEQKAAGLGVYGPRTTITLAVDGIDGAHEFLLVDDETSKQNGQWIRTQSFYTIKEGKLFAPGNLRATQDNKGYDELFKHWYTNKYQLRYTGGMVPDVNQIMIKGKGIFCNAASKNAKAKLRLLYEVAPIGYVIEKAGGASSDGVESVLNIRVIGTEDRSQVAYGSKGEVARFEKLVGKKYL